MAEYIEREAALYRAKSFIANHIDGIVAEHAQLPYETCNATEFSRGYERGATDAVKVVLSTPAADVDVVKHGRWERLPDNEEWAYCSQCHCCWEWEIINNCNVRYCPNCGAKMEVDDGHL